MITIGGLLTSTFLTLVIVPVVYCLMDRVSDRAWSILSIVIPKPPPEKLERETA
jgi:hypothetical protein